VAMGRAMVRRPTVFLMDEPLSNLDATLRVSMRAELSKMHSRLGVTTVYVTHDQVEAMTLGDRVAVMRDGRVQQCDTPRRLFDRPCNVFVAAFIGLPSMNLVQGKYVGGRVRIGSWNWPVTPGHAGTLAATSNIIVGVRPSDFGLEADSPATWARVEVRPVAVEEFGHERIVKFKVDAAGVAGEPGPSLRPGADQRGLFADDTALEFSALIAGRATVGVGVPLRLAVNTEALYFFDAASGVAL